MIVARLFGGLGNQLFIYAAARAMSVRCNLPLTLDVTSGFLNDQYGRNFSLGEFNIQAGMKRPSNDYLRYIDRWRLRALRRVSSLLPLNFAPIVCEKDWSVFDRNVIGLKRKDNFYLEGYWKSEKYFSDTSDIIRRELKITGSISAESQSLAEGLKKENSIAIHVRRYSEVKIGAHDSRKAISNVLGEDYYRETMLQMANEVSNPHFYCFTDEPEWVRGNFCSGFPMTIVSHNHKHGDKHAYEDLWLMKHCRRFIIANSTFSWWGAWLSDHPSKTVFAPRPELCGNRDFIPDGWRTFP